MNTETLALLRAMVAKIDALCAEGHGLDEACRSVDATPRSYRRWTEILAFSRSADREVHSDSIVSIVPELEAEFGRTKFAAGEVLFRLGDYADHMYVVASGSVLVSELDTTVSAGEILGEIGVFSESHRRMASAVCLEDCELIRLPRERALELTYRKPTIGLAMTQIIANRLSLNAEQARVASARACLSGTY